MERGGTPTKKIWFIKNISRNREMELAWSALDRGDVVIGTTCGDLPRLRARTGELHLFNLDVVKHEEIEATIRLVFARHGRLDVITNDACFGPLKVEVPSLSGGERSPLCGTLLRHAGDASADAVAA